MKRIHYISLLGCALLVLALLAGLYATSSLNNKIFRGDFRRRFIPGPELHSAEIMKLGTESCYIVGASGEDLFLGNYASPLSLLKTDFNLSDSQHISLKGLEHLRIIDPMQFRIKIDSPFFYMDHGTTPLILKGIIGDWEAYSFMPDTAYYFVDGLPITSSSWILRSYSIRTKQYELAKKISYDSPFFQFKYNLLKKQKDGLFDLEGSLHYNRERNEVVYLYRYRNDCFVTDTSMSLLRSFKTIDPFDTVLIKTEKLKDAQSTMLASPPFIINYLSAIAHNKLYVQSNVLSQNEDQKLFEESSVIDVYELKDGEYLHSFYLKPYLQRKIVDFRVYGKYIVCIYGNTVVVYNWADLNL